MSSIIYLSVPFEDRAEVKSLGGKWDKKKVLWYVEPNDPNKNIMLEKWPLNLVLIDEDREFGGNQLFIDLIPRTMWYANVRSSVIRRDWDKLRNLAYMRANYKCEICQSDTDRLEAHERFDYNFETKTQTLKRIIALCSTCHAGTHMGLTETRGSQVYIDRIVNHFKKVAKMTDAEYKEHSDEAFKTYNLRSKFKWNLDLSLLTKNNFTILSPEEAATKSNAKTYTKNVEIQYDD